MAAEMTMREGFPHKNTVISQVKKKNMTLERTSNEYTDKVKPVVRAERQSWTEAKAGGLKDIRVL